MSTAVSKRLFTVHEYFRMVETGILAERDRVELIDGEVVAMTPIGPRHNACVGNAAEALVLAAAGRVLVRSQGSVRLNLFTQPEPDVVALRPRPDRYARSHPGPDDILLVIEVADSSLAYDRDVKAPVYARAGIPEYWLVDLPDNLVLRHQQPEGARYRRVDALRRGDSLAPAFLPECAIAADILLIE